MNFDDALDNELTKKDKTGSTILRKILSSRDTDTPSIDIRVQQRRSKKFITTMQGIGSEFDFKKILKAFKKV